VPRPTEAAQAALHDAAEYHEHPYLVHRRRNVAALDRRCRAIFERIGMFVDLATLRGERVLDVGCDTGDFIASAARQFGLCPAGVDVAHLAAHQARANGIEAYHSTLEEAPESLSGLRVITAIDLIEHVPDPERFCRALYDRLRPGGVAYIETPNVDSTVYRFGRALCAVTGGRPAGPCTRLFPHEHIQYFSREGLRRVAESCGLRVLRLESRTLPAPEIAVGAFTRTALHAMQLFDSVSGERLLRWAIVGRRHEE
jgi:2-polyprenyl-3-methyl-5-hydroxy-6-metoxy-1,4-benzoquinol methylase